jgi:hypothetical protein
VPAALSDAAALDCMLPNMYTSSVRIFAPLLSLLPLLLL